MVLNPPPLSSIMVTINTARKIVALKLWDCPPRNTLDIGLNYEKNVNRLYEEMLAREGVTGICLTPCQLWKTMVVWIRWDENSASLREFLRWREEDDALAEEFLVNTDALPVVTEDGVYLGQEVTLEAEQPLASSDVDVQSSVESQEGLSPGIQFGSITVAEAADFQASCLEVPEVLGHGNVAMVEVTRPNNAGSVLLCTSDANFESEIQTAIASGCSVRKVLADVRSGSNRVVILKPVAAPAALEVPLPERRGRKPVAVVADDSVVVRCHRRIRQKDSFAKLCLAEARAEFGVPIRNYTNQLAVRRFANGYMKDHKLRAFDRSRLLPMIIAAIFVPTDEDLMGAAWLTCAESKERMKLYGNAAFKAA